MPFQLAVFLTYTYTPHPKSQVNYYLSVLMLILSSRPSTQNSMWSPIVDPASNTRGSMPTRWVNFFRVVKGEISGKYVKREIKKLKGSDDGADFEEEERWGGSAGDHGFGSNAVTSDLNDGEVVSGAQSARSLSVDSATANFIDSKLTMMTEEDMLMQQIAEKAEGVKEINRDMQSLNLAFKQVAEMVDGQAEFVNKLETNAEETNESTKRAVEDLEDALRYQKKATCAMS